MTDARLTPVRLAEIRARLAAATPGPWEASAHKAHPTTGDWDYFEEEHGVYPPLGQRGPVALAPGAANAALIAHAPADLAALLAEVEAMRAERDRMEDALRWVNGEVGDWPGTRPEGRGPYWWRREMMQRAGLDPQHVDTPEAPC